MKKIITILAVFMLIMLAACNTAPQDVPKAQIQEESTPEPVEESEPMGEMAHDSMDEAEPEAMHGMSGESMESMESEGEVKEFTMDASDWAFAPNKLEVNEGDTVRITISSSQGTHGLAIPSFGVSEKGIEGEEKIIEFVADKKGDHSFFCNVPCGSGHREMKGTLVVN